MQRTLEAEAWLYPISNLNMFETICNLVRLDKVYYESLLTACIPADLIRVELAATSEENIFLPSST